MSKKTVVMPLGHERTKIIARLGRDHYTYTGEPQRGKARHETMGEIDVWYFDFNKFEVDVQVVLATRYAKQHDCQFSEAVQYLKSHLTAIPCNRVELEVMEGGE